MKKVDGKYMVDLGLKWVDDKIVMPQLKEEKLREYTVGTVPLCTQKALPQEANA